ncbi:hypothetical protein K461DRAFT_133363 [Myriangium duriaei CBS 260.36]|uniref:Uncharacterized protein n=1 Tax=Myriangium duriaei CBS 260.36 TaxID=1168546 RepID=A0A9P4MHA4_9PEZI|nr:hypothetical protein K461DRAFT_133363 [Myriangium duriaei CBS 260.36]
MLTPFLELHCHSVAVAWSAVRTLASFAEPAASMVYAFDWALAVLCHTRLCACMQLLLQAPFDNRHLADVMTVEPTLKPSGTSAASLA